MRERTGRRRPVIVTQGDPEGVGPQLVLRLGASREVGEGDLVVADPEVMRGWAARLGTDWAHAGLAAVQPLLVATHGEGRGASQVASLRRAVDEVLARPDHALVTAPIDKHACADAGFAFPGHTEYLAARAGDVSVAMLLVGPRLKVALATIHVALRDVASRLSEAAIVSSGGLLAEALTRRFALAAPRIAVLGLNPHAGEGGLLGGEERTIVGPAVTKLRAAFPGVTFTDPIPADTAFAFAMDGRYDAVLAMYHDQGLGPFKLVHFHDGVNMTLGLPFVRTSPDHGTARDIAAAGTADVASMRAAVALAREVAA